MKAVGLALGVLLGTGGSILIVFTIAFRSRTRVVHDAIRRFNRDVTNPRRLRTAGRAGAYAAVVHHVGRRTGAAYRTPVVAVEHGTGLLFALPYGARADWVRNVLAAGEATVAHEGRTVPVTRPEVIGPAEANPAFPGREQRMHRLYGVREFLTVDRADREDPPAGPEGRP